MDADGTEDGPPERGGEVRTAGLHSPFGLLGKLRIERGLSLRDLLWGEPWALLVLETADQPRISKRNHDAADEDEDLPTVDF